jgi:4-hydroxy-tetrahydrodipicolinate synthase
MFHGPISAIVTPFKNGKVDQDAYAKLIEFQVKGGVTGIVSCGTTGEASTLSDDEQIATIALAVKCAKGRVPVIAGAGSNETRHAIDLTCRARDAGASAALLVTPYYNKTTQAGLVTHFTAVAKAVPGFPIILYNVPGRTGLNLLPATAARLAELPNIVAIKEASANIGQSVEILVRTRGKMTVLSGEDALYLPLLAIGAKGIISVTANVAPKLMADLYRAFVAGDLKKARALHEKLWPVHEAMFCEVNPIPVKAALAMMGKIHEEYRLPLVPIGKENRARVAAALKGAGLLEG